MKNLFLVILLSVSFSNAFGGTCGQICKSTLDAASDVFEGITYTNDYMEIESFVEELCPAVENECDLAAIITDKKIQKSRRTHELEYVRCLVAETKKFCSSN